MWVRLIYLTIACGLILYTTYFKDTLTMEQYFEHLFSALFMAVLGLYHGEKK